MDEKNRDRVPISIAITSFNDEDNIGDFLNNITRQSVKVDEIVITDGGSNDNTINIIMEFIKTSTDEIVLRKGGHLNIAEGLNDAIKNCRNSIICILGIGNSFPDTFIEDLFAAFLANDADVMCPYICGVDSNSFSRAYNRIVLNNNIGMNGIYAPNHGCIVKKQVFIDLGFFYEGFYYAGEDAEFYSRAKNEGYTVVSDPNIVLYWETPCSFAQLKRQIELYTIAEEQWMEKKKIIWNQKKSISLILILLGSITSLLYPLTVWVGVFGIGGLLLLHMSWIMKYGIVGAQIIVMRVYYKLFCFIKYRRFGKGKYAIHRM